MPNIPIVISKETIPGTTGMPMQPMEDQVGQALQRTGGQLENTFGEMHQRIANAERLVDASKHENFLKTWADKKVEALKGRTDYENFESEAEASLSELQDYIGKISDRKVRQAVEASAQHTIRDYASTVRVKKVEVLTDVGKANIEQSVLSDIDEWVKTSPDDVINTETGPVNSREFIKNKIESKYIAGARAGIYKQSEVVAITKGLDGKLEETYARELINNDKAIELKKIFDEGGLTSIDPIKRQELYALTKAKAKEQEATNILVELQEKYVDNPENPLHEDGTQKTPLELRADAWKEITSTEFLKKYGADMQHKVMQHWSENENKLRDEYKIKADEVKGSLIVDILNRNMKKGGLTGDERWLSLTASDRAYVTNFLDAQRRADRSEAMGWRSLKMQERQIQKQQYQEDAQAFSLKMLSDIAGGKYTDENQIIKACTVSNPYILKSTNSFLSTFKTIATSPDLKQGIAEINKAAKAGSLDKDYKRSIILGGELATVLRTKYMSEPEFRGQKINEWIKAQIEPTKKRTVGDMLNGFWSGVVQGTYDANIKDYGTPPQQKLTPDEQEAVKRGFKKVNGRWTK